jgi:hypothetical protein
MSCMAWPDHFADKDDGGHFAQPSAAEGYVHLGHLEQSGLARLDHTELKCFDIWKLFKPVYSSLKPFVP